MLWENVDAATVTEFEQKPTAEKSDSRIISDPKWSAFCKYICSTEALIFPFHFQKQAR